MTKILSAITSCVFALSSAFGQVSQPGGEYVIQGIFSPTIADARKIDLRPEPIDTILLELPVNYDLLPVQANIPASVDSIAPARVDLRSAQQRLYKGYVKAGFGLYTTPLGELYYDQTRSRNNGYGFHAKHFSSNGGLDDVGPSDYSFNSIDGYYKHYFPTHEVQGRLMYDRRRVSYYGYTSNDSIQDALDALEPPEDALKQVYNDIGFAGRIRSLYKDSTRIAHDVGLEVHSCGNLTGSRETNVLIDADLSMVEGRETYGLGVLLDNNSYRGFLGGVVGDFRQNGTLVGFTPTVRTSAKNYEVRIGAGLYVDAMSTTSFHFFPIAYASYSLFDDILVPYVGVEGDRRRNSFRSLSMENPWLVGAPSLSNTSRMYDLYGGLRGSFSSRLGFDVRISRIRMDEMPLFVTYSNEPYGDQFVPTYDQVDILNIGGELRYHMKSAWDVTARIDVVTYETLTEAEAWNLPPYQIAIGAVYDMRGKLIIRAEAQFLGERKARGEQIETQNTTQPVMVYDTVDLEGFMDLYLGLEYRYTKRLSVFLDLSNISASKYERWYRYNVQRGLVLGGATYAF